MNSKKKVIDKEGEGGRGLMLYKWLNIFTEWKVWEEGLDDKVLSS